MANRNNDQGYPFDWRHDKKVVGTFEKFTISTVKTVRSSIWIVIVSLRIHSNVETLLPPCTLSSALHYRLVTTAPRGTNHT